MKKMASPLKEPSGKGSSTGSKTKVSEEVFVSMVLVLYTGGTIGMKPNTDGLLEPVQDRFEQRIRQDINLNDSENDSIDFLFLPAQKDKKRLSYRIYEFNPLLDSSNMGKDDWIRIAQKIYNEYTKYNGFVIVQGTDTLAYTASILSFMLENLGKPVIVTGSQIPIYETGSDGIMNLVLSLKLAGFYKIPEVGVVFYDKMFRGNRTFKINCESLNAFDSPNYPSLATSGVDINLREDLIYRPKLVKPFNVQLSLDGKVALLHITPDMPMEQVRAVLQSSVNGVVLQTFGAGNIPSNNRNLIEELKAAIKKDVIIVNCTQCIQGSVVNAYDVSSELNDMGIIFLHDITMVAAYTKLIYVTSKTNWSLEKKKEMMKRNLRGELKESQS